VQALERLSLQIQEVARVLTGDAPLRQERLDLLAAVQEALVHPDVPVTIAPADSPVEVLTSAGVLAQLIDLVLDHVAALGAAAADIRVSMQGRPPRPMMIVHARRRSTDAGTAPERATLSWALLALLAQAVGIAAHHDMKGSTTTLSIAFPATVRDEAPSMDAQDDLPWPRVHGLQGQRVLLVEPREATRIEAHRLMREAGMQVATLPTTAHVADAFREGVPDAIVSGFPADDPRLSSLLDCARAADPRLAVVELVDDDVAFTTSAGPASPARVSRHDLDRTLLSALAQELESSR
jgi:hypothetical protein